MCGLFASRDPEKLEELFQLNTRRGQTRMSLTPFGIGQTGKDLWMEVSYQSDEIRIRSEYTWPGRFHLGHIQAPTSVLNMAHPAEYGGVHIWHNGILKEETIKRLQRGEGGDKENWDTFLMARALREVANETHPSDVLSSLDGSFACFMYALGQMYVFRNEISPLFVDDQLNFSSVKFKGSNSIEPGIIFGLDFTYNKLDDIGVHFTTANNPYIL